MMLKIPFEPTNENVSTHSPPKKNKNTLLAQLTAFIKNSGLSLPPRIAKLVGSGLTESPLKEAVTNREQAEDPKKLKIQLADLQFQFKKLEEDFAEYKRAVKYQKEREAKKNQESIGKLKQALQNSNEDGLYNISKLKEQHAKELNGLRERTKLELEQETTKIINQYQTKLQSQEKTHIRYVAELQKQFDRRFNEKVQNLKQQIAQMTARHAQDIKELSLRHKHIIQEKEKRHESIRVAVESQKRTEEKMHEKTKLDSLKEKEKLITELCFERNVKTNLQEELEAREKDIRRLKNTIKDREDDLILLQEKTKKQLSNNQQQYKLQVQQLEKLQAEQILELKHQQQKDIQSLQKRITDLEVLQKQKEQLLTSNLEELALNFDRRPSKKEDLAEIEKMKWALTRREEEIRKLSKDIKYCNLELENKEDLYTRIFRGNSLSRDKKNREREDKEHAVEEKIAKELIYRKSQTSDIKFLLKHYNPQKNG